MKRRPKSASMLRLAAPEVAHGVAVAPVPLGPVGREVADLVAALAHVPGFGDELHGADDRVLLDDVEEGREAVDGVQLAGQRGRQVEAEAVDVHLLDPVAQAVHDELQDVRLEHVERVAGAGVVEVAARVVRLEPVVGLVVEAPQRERRAVVAAFAGVVVDDVEDDLQAGRVERPDHGLELADLLAARAARRRTRRAARSSRSSCSPSSCAGLARAGSRRARNWCVGSSSTEVTPRRSEVLDGGRVGEAREGAADGLGNRRVSHA